MNATGQISVPLHFPESKNYLKTHVKMDLSRLQLLLFKMGDEEQILVAWSK
jgi:hypothetical protein